MINKAYNFEEIELLFGGVKLNTEPFESFEILSDVRPRPFMDLTLTLRACARRIDDKPETDNFRMDLNGEVVVAKRATVEAVHFCAPPAHQGAHRYYIELFR